MLTVAVTGPTGEIGRPFIAALERTPEVGRVIGMARRPFDIGGQGWEKTEYRRGDILDREAVEALVEEADVVVHLAFVIVAGGKESREVNLTGSRNVFEATAAARRQAAGLHVLGRGLRLRPRHAGAARPRPCRPGAPAPPTTRRTRRRSRRSWSRRSPAPTPTPTSSGPASSPARGDLLLDLIPLLALGQRIPSPLRWALGRVPELRPVLPDPGVPFQLVHHDDVAAALAAAVLGHGEPGVYNLAGPGELTISDLARALGWHSVPAPHLAVSATAEAVALMPFLPDEAAWIEAVRRPVLMDTARARRKLHWMPHHDARETLRQTVAAVRAR